MTQTTKGRILNILLTGCTAQQCDPNSHRRTTNFMGLFRRALHRSDHEVFWQEPSISWSPHEILARFDHVVIGLAPVTSMSANRVYGALSLYLELMNLNSGRVSVLLDAPGPDRIAAGNRAIYAHPENLTKNFYSYRKEYLLAVQNRDRLLQAVEALHEQPWPTTIVPCLPWQTAEILQKRLPYKAKRVVALNLDTLLFDDLPVTMTRPRRETWLADGAPRQPISLPTQAIPHKGHPSYDKSVIHQMAGSLGVLLESGRDGTWWSSRYAQSLSTTTPVFSDWRETGLLGYAWSILPGNIETMTPAERTIVAEAQLEAYRARCPDYASIARMIGNLLHPRSRTFALAGDER